MISSRILVVDDDRYSAALVSRVLTDEGYHVDIAMDGPSALAMIEQHPYALAVVDYQMPGMNGVEFFRAARRNLPELTGIFLTAYANINTVFPAIEAGIDRVLAKPLDARELIRLAAEIVGPAGQSATT